MFSETAERFTNVKKRSRRLRLTKSYGVLAFNFKEDTNTALTVYLVTATKIAFLLIVCERGSYKPPLSIFNNY